MLSKKKQISVKGPHPSVELQSKTPPHSQPTVVPNGQTFKNRKLSTTPVVKTEPGDTKLNGKPTLNRSLSQGEREGKANRENGDHQQQEVLAGIITNLGNVIVTDNERQRQRELRKLIAALSNWESIDDKTLIKLLNELQKSIESVDEKFSTVLQQILLGNWYSRPDKVVSSVESFLYELLVVRPAFVGTAIFSFICKFCPYPSFDQVDTISPAEAKMFTICHRNLQRICETFPTKQKTAANIIEQVYPYMGRNPHIHYGFIHNILKALDYLPHVRGRLIHVIINKLARIDVNISREDLQTQSDLDHTVVIKMEDGGRQEQVFEMDLEDVNLNHDHQQQETRVNPLIETMDICLDMVFQTINKIWTNPINPKVEHDDDDDHDEEEDDDSQETKSWWDSDDVKESLLISLLDTFETELLPAFGLNNVQFLYFYLLSLNPSFLTRFLDFLWKKATNMNTSPVIRIQTMSFLSGILARASFVSVKTVKRWLTRLSEWSNTYSSQRSKTVHWATVNIQAHGPFYAVCQTIFYVFAFRNKEIITSRKCAAFTRSLDLGRLLTSELNPLKACHPEIGSAFVQAAHHHQISYCGTVLERNQLATIPTVAQTDVGGESDPFAATQLEAFFPFDPFLLPRSKRWTEGMHLDYDPYLGEREVKQDEEQDSVLGPNRTLDEDSIEMELGSYDSKSFKGHGFLSSKFKADDMGLIMDE